MKSLEDLSKVEDLSADDKAEYERIQAEISKCEDLVGLLEKGRVSNYKARNYRYILDFEIPYQRVGNFDDDGFFLGPTNTPLLFESSTIVKKDTKFFCTSVDCATYFTGRAFQTNTPVVLALKPYERQKYLNFEWAVRDTGSDRAWQNQFLPMSILKTNRINSLVLSTPTVLSGGAELFVSCQINYMYFFPGQALSEIKNFLIQFSFSGYEVSES